MDGGLVIGRLATFIETHELLKKTRLAIEEVIEDLSWNQEEEAKLKAML